MVSIVAQVRQRAVSISSKRREPRTAVSENPFLPSLSLRRKSGYHVLLPGSMKRLRSSSIGGNVVRQWRARAEGRHLDNPNESLGKYCFDGNSIEVERKQKAPATSFE